MKRRSGIASLWLLAVLFLGSCTSTEVDRMDFVFYNVENLFDTIDDPMTKDDRFTPQSDLHWDSEKYALKLDHLAQVIAQLGGVNGNFPSVVALSEVENKRVLQDLLSVPVLKKAGYRVIHQDGPDERGLDEALLYNPEHFKVVSYDYKKVPFPWQGFYSSAYYLYVKGCVKKDTVHLFINHWISRWKGKSETEAYRVFLAETIREEVDSIFERDSRANIILAGDFNDNPNNKSIRSVLKAKKPKMPILKRSLYNLAWYDFEQGRGTIFNQGKWDMFDQIIVSSSLLTGENGLQVTSSKQKIVNYDWLLKEQGGVKIPFRTAAKEYLGGYSDHLPVMIEINLDNRADVSSII